MRLKPQLVAPAVALAEVPAVEFVPAGDRS